MSNEKDSTFKELDEIVQAIVREYLGNVKEYADGTKGATPFHQKESVLGAIEVFNSYSQMVATDDYKMDRLRLQIYNQTIQTLKNAKKGAGQNLIKKQDDEEGYISHSVSADAIIEYLGNCNYDVASAWKVISMVRDRLHDLAYKSQIKQEDNEK